jgi:DNA polymerase III delta prime subunit
MDMNTILSRTIQENLMIDFLTKYNKMDEKEKRGIYISGPPGCGKTMFAKTILKKMNFDVITYNVSESRNKNIVDSINVNNMSDTNVMSFFLKKKKNIVMLMDEIDSMNNGDKGGINALIKLVRPKKTKKQKLEDTTHLPIVCIGNTTYDKKIQELVKCCLVIELKAPTSLQIKHLIDTLVPVYSSVSSQVKDLKKVFQLVNLNQKNFQGDIQSVFYTITHEDSRQITKRILNSSISFQEHLYINDTERTIISLLWHENIIDILQKISFKKRVVLYHTLLKEICFADFIDRITFQKQLWRFNEMSFLLKTFYTNSLCREFVDKYKVNDIRFTKVLTKYSTEYNNNGFIQKMCNELCMDKKDLFSYMHSLKPMHTEQQIHQKFEHTDITLLDVQRMYRYMNKCID